MNRPPDDPPPGSAVDPPGADPDDPGATPKKGSDLAREALAAARRKNATQRHARTTIAARSGGPRGLRRRRWSGAGPDSRDPQPFSATLQKFLAGAGAGAELTRATVMARWPELVGATVADHCTPTQLVDGVLTLQCESTAWAAQLRLLAPQLVRSLNQALGHGTVTRITATGPSAPSWRFGPRHVSGRGPRDTYG